MLTDDCIEFKFLGISFSFYVSTAHTHVCQYTQRERFIPTNPDKLSTNGQHILHLTSILCRCDDLFLLLLLFLQSFDKFVNSLHQVMRKYQIYQSSDIKRIYKTSKTELCITRNHLSTSYFGYELQQKYDSVLYQQTND